ncbi:MAG: hypothetical protein H6707_15620 [Deltaproteobacteria bacterium]|nr:hypothetical protein [Deltaproteobacteria bacterium]
MRVRRPDAIRRRARRCAAVCGLFALLIAATAAAAKPPAPTKSTFGVSLGLFAEDPQFNYRSLLAEIAAIGATDVALIVPIYQHNVRSNQIALDDRRSPTLTQLRQSIAQARQLNLGVLVFPILRLHYALTADEWRGALRPRAPDRWWQSYQQVLATLATEAQRSGARALCIGSELSTLDTDPTHWRPLIAAIRRKFSGRLLYSANWDHYRDVKLWSLVDTIGISGYFPLTEAGKARPKLNALITGWRHYRVDIGRFWHKLGKPIIFTEVGYRSRPNSSAAPWEEIERSGVDLALQRDAFEAFRRVWQTARFLRGFYIWNWFGWGGASSDEYTPRDKPAASLLCEWFGGSQCRTQQAKQR